MKKITLSMILLLIVNVSFAKIEYGIKGGMNFSNIYSTNLNTNFKKGYHLGAYSTINVVVFDIQPELMFSQRGYKESNLKETTLNYIDIPLLLKFKALPIISVDFGPQFSYLISKNIKDNSNTFILQPNFKNAEVSGVFGASIQIWKIGLASRYIIGFSDIEKLNTSKNYQFQVSLSLKL